MSLAVYLHDKEGRTLYNDTITHNLGKMARAAGCYETLWSPLDSLAHLVLPSEQICELADHFEALWQPLGSTVLAVRLIPQLEVSLDILERHPDHFSAFNAPNGWGNYDNLVSFVRGYLDACKEFPDAEVCSHS